MNRPTCNEPGCTRLTNSNGKYFVKKCWKHKRDVDVVRKLNVDRYKRTKSLVFTHYGNKCKCCGEQEPIFLTIDHINNDGNKHRKVIGRKLYAWIVKNNFPDTFQILCFNCNTGRHFNGGICPHQQKN